jgi:hypothetical protein
VIHSFETRFPPADLSAGDLSAGDLSAGGFSAGGFSVREEDADDGR